eukprot:Gb_22694 [translate_table: standard]
MRTTTRKMRTTVSLFRKWLIKTVQDAKDKELQSHGKRSTATHQINFALMTSVLDAREPTTFVEALLDKENAIGSDGLKKAEVDTLRMVKHKNIVNSHSIFCMYKYMPNGNLFIALHKNNGEKAFKGGTNGYIVLEYAYSFKVKEKCNTYNFSVVLLELISGKQLIEPEFGELTAPYFFALVPCQDPLLTPLPPPKLSCKPS